jgi:hypothetical protein
MINMLFGTVQKTAMAATIGKIIQLDSSAADFARFLRSPAIQESRA